MRYISFYFRTLVNIIKYNPIKILIVLSLFLSIQFFNKYPKDVIEYKIQKIEVIGGDSLSIVSKKGESQIEYLILFIENNNVKFKDDSIEPIESNGNIVTHNTNDLIAIWLFFSIILFIISMVISFTDDDFSWDIHHCAKKARSKFIECEKEGDVYYYTAFDRLIRESNQMLSKNSIIEIDWSISDLSLFPSFQTKRRNRESLLSKLKI